MSDLQIHLRHNVSGGTGASITCFNVKHHGPEQSAVPMFYEVEDASGFHRFAIHSIEFVIEVPESARKSEAPPVEDKSFSRWFAGLRRKGAEA